MSGISTHILDTSQGRPAAGVEVTLERASGDVGWIHCASATTDGDGRCKDLLGMEKLLAGKHRLSFATGAYFQSVGQASLYPEVTITFLVETAGTSYHIPLLLSPFGYTTYRGS